MNKLEQAKKTKLEELKRALSNYIYTFYNKIEQDADKTARETMVNRLLTVNNTYTIEELYVKIGQYALNLMTGVMTVKDVIAQIPIQELEYWEKLIKIAIRLAWIEMCIMKYKQIKIQIIKATTISEVLGIDKDTFLSTLPLYPQDLISQLELEVINTLGL